MKTKLYCRHFIQAGFSNKCCDSCHDDDELGYEMLFLEPNGRSNNEFGYEALLLEPNEQSNTVAYICCEMSRVLEALGVSLRDAFAQALLAHRKERREN